MSLSQRALNVVGSITLKIDAVAKRMKAEGKDVIGFGAGEPDYGTPQYIIDAGKKALDMGLTRYTPASGSLDLKKAVCEKFKVDNGLVYDPSQIVISNGAKHSLYNIFLALLDPGDEVIIPSPFWVSYPEMVKMAGGVPVYVETFEEDGFVAKAKNIEKAITKRTKALIINSPGNPCGGVYGRDDLEAIAEVAKAYNIRVVSDEIYEKLIYDGEKHVSIASLDDDIKALTIVVNGFSKAFAMTGWRLGYLAADVETAKAIGRLQSHSTSNPNSIAQYAGVIALQNGEKEIAEMVTEFDARRKMICQLINDTPGMHCMVPKGAFYVMGSIESFIGKCYKGKMICGSMDFARLLLDDYCVAVVPGVAFGEDHYLRFSYAISREKIQDGLLRIRKFTADIH